MLPCRVCMSSEGATCETRSARSNSEVGATMRAGRSSLFEFLERQDVRRVCKACRAHVVGEHAEEPTEPGTAACSSPCTW
jgi:hypothetical protein